MLACLRRSQIPIQLYALVAVAHFIFLSRPSKRSIYTVRTDLKLHTLLLSLSLIVNVVVYFAGIFSLAPSTPRKKVAAEPILHRILSTRSSFATLVDDGASISSSDYPKNGTLHMLCWDS